ncbi:serine hydrolase domain-containing protein [Microlunatus ginsengisoli]|uniref:serine hydrolase domain-containing protein n=1 Tax=Microlunatus ginsengisoli TaxID=363863 RepID=UPI0031E104A4
MCDADRARPWRRDTIAMPYSVSKPFAAGCALVLVDRGLLDLGAPLRTYWPEMQADTTMRQVLSHQSAHVLLDDPAPAEAFYDWELMCGLVAKPPPLWPPGSGCGEPALQRALVGEVVRRVDGRSLGRFLRDEVCDPLGSDFHVGLSPADLTRAADLTGLDEAKHRIAPVTHPRPRDRQPSRCVRSAGRQHGTMAEGGGPGGDRARHGLRHTRVRRIAPPTLTNAAPPTGRSPTMPYTPLAVTFGLDGCLWRQCHNDPGCKQVAVPVDGVMPFHPWGRPISESILRPLSCSPHSW